ncbi:hypothetical protein KTT_50790 [Tengunoibacter tsumagoiensis]|uniref:Major facilitator superfamily (MFS) profile domain-containing protein n=2 Tax=Tengunoibacter tsumagoiensis TaxID=2014871 RepID=A0A402A7R8_9CHLR|nr:hypothetical protein KTT_50790 [Tengunoibacter tsumagoiensis]
MMTGIICLAYGTFAFTGAGWGPLLPPLSTQLQLPLDQVGLLVVAWSFGYIPGALTGGNFLDRSGPRFVLALATFLMTIGVGALFLFLTFHVNVLIGLICFSGVIGAGGGMVDSTGNGLISTLYKKKSATALNLFTQLYPLSSMIIALIDGLLLLWFHGDARPPLLVTFSMGIVTLLATIFMPTHLPKEETEEIVEALELPLPRASLWKRLQALLTIQAPVALGIFLVAGVITIVRTWAATYLHVIYGQDINVAATWSGIMLGLSVVAGLLISLIIGRLGAWRMSLISMSASILGLLLLLCFSSQTMALISLTIAIIGLTPLAASFLSLGNERSQGNVGSVMGLLFFSIGISNTIYNWIFSFLFNRVGPSWGIVFCIVALTGGIVAALTLRPQAR